MKAKKRILILFIICFVILVGALVIDKINSKEYLIKLNYQEFAEKINNKDSFALCISRTTCSHCASYKPKLEKISKEYKTEIYYIEVDQITEEEYNKIKEVADFGDSTPTTVFFVDGEERIKANRISGDMSYDKILKKLKSNGIIK